MNSETRETEPFTPTAGHTGADPDAPHTTETTDAPAGKDTHGATPPAGTPDSGRKPRFDPPALIAAIGLLVLSLGFVLFGVLRDGDDEAQTKTPTAPVTYQVTGEGTADLSYQGTSEKGTAETVSRARLPWTKTVKVPLGQTPVITITLDDKGSQARCAIAVHGRHMQSATASGAYGRATCTATLPTPAPTPPN